MRANVETLLSLYEWGEIVGINPFELAQIGEGYTQKTDRRCKHVFYQHPWQEDHLSRNEVARAIAQAESRLASYLGYWPAPRYVEGESPRYPKPANSIWYGDGRDVRGQWKPVELRWKYLHGGGTLARTAIASDVQVNLDDEDGNAPDDTFIVTTPTTITDPGEIALYFTATDRMGRDLDETWRIRPLRVSISAGTATIKGHISQVVVPYLQEGTDPQSLDASKAIYITEVDVYRVYRDTTATDANPQQGNAEWDLQPDPAPTGVVETKGVILSAYNQRLGIGRIEIPQTWPQDREPDKLTINYLAGLSLDRGKMQTRFANAVAHLSLAYLAREQCGCERSNRIISYWREFPSDFNERSRPLSISEIDAPGGPTRGAREAWELIQEDRLTT